MVLKVICTRNQHNTQISGSDMQGVCWRWEGVDLPHQAPDGQFRDDTRGCFGNGEVGCGEGVE